MTDSWDRTLATMLAANTDDLHPTDSAVRRVLERDDARASASRTQRRRLIAAATAIVLGSTVYAVPPTRAALDDVYGSRAPARTAVIGGSLVASHTCQSGARSGHSVE